MVNAAVKADPRTNKAKLTVQAAIKGFVDAFANGKIKGFSEMLDPDVTFTTTRRGEVISFTKTEMLDDLKKSANIVQNCQTKYEIIESLPNQALVKVTMKYENFSKENLITLTDSNKGWRITKISTSFR